jgi:translation initiation factor 5B
MLRQVIVTMMGNVDAGKSQTIDTIKRTSIVRSEPGKITQTIKAYNISMDVIKKLVHIDTSKIKIPGLLFVDTPGHASFSNLRKRGGSLADIAVLILDINDGIKPQTVESIEILKESKTPFVIALNKLDLMPGWESKKEGLVQNIKNQTEQTQQNLDNRIYSLLGEFYEKHEINMDRFDRIEDYTKTIAAIPLSAKTGEGIPELLMVLTGLAQKFLETKLESNLNGPGKATVLEVVEEKGLGKTFDTILYEGRLKKGDQIVVGTLDNPLITKIKALFTVENNKLKPIPEATAAMGIKISTPENRGVISGMPLMVANENLDQIEEDVMEQLKEITFELDEEGVVVKADSVGSLEALINTLREKNIKVKRGSVGEISKKDIAEADSTNNKMHKAILGFRVSNLNSEKVKVITHDVIYTLLEKFDEWMEEKQKELDAERWKGISKPFKLKFMPGCTFRQSNPAVLGVEVMVGTVKAGANIFKDDKRVGEVKAIQREGKTIQEAKEGEEIAVSLPGVIVGRQLKEGDIVYSDLSEEEFRRFKELKKYLNESEVLLLKEIAEIKRTHNSVWGIG